MQKSFHVTASSIYPLGVSFVPEGLHISAVCESKAECGILLYDKHHKNGVRIPFLPESRKGNIYAMLLQGYQDRDCSYLFYQGDELLQDHYTYALQNERKYGEKCSTPARCKVLEHTYDWEGDHAPLIPYEESIFYMLHVRGFTKHRSSGVQAKGTYAGIIEKIPYLRELGITAVLLMPTYEFDEILTNEKQPRSMEQAALAYKEQLEEPGEQEKPAYRINYWGYQEGLYFLPKYAYSSKKDAVCEFKDMVKALHQNGIEVMMQFYFPPTVGYMKMLDILKHWVLEYHVDGFHLMGTDIPMHLLRKEPLFAETKLIGEKEASCHGGQSSSDTFYRNVGFMNDGFLYDMRKLLKGDANMIESLITLNRKNPPDIGIVNYIAKQDGFRLYDLVSYNEKHNEENGEDNKDGTSDNFSWNCGIEGKTRKKNVLELRLRQMKNALTFVFFSQGTPLLYSGDEFANTQEGNNNPYCQDNPVCWVKWNQLKMGDELLSYTKELIALRKAHSILHRNVPLRGMDYLSCGYPDISLHGREAWIPNTSADSRSLGIMYCGRYGKAEDTNADSLLYIGINMHWMPQQFGLPQIPKGREWYKILSTDAKDFDKETALKEEPDAKRHMQIPPRTIVIYGTRTKAEESKTVENTKKEKQTEKKKSSKRIQETI